MQIRWSIFNAAQRERLNGAVRRHHHSIHHVLLVEPLCLKVMHGVVGVIGRHMTRRALTFAEKYFLSMYFGGRSFGGIEFSIPAQLGSGRGSEQLLKFRHEMNLAAAFQYIHTFLGGDDGVSVKIGGSLFELGEVLNCLQSTL